MRARLREVRGHDHPAAVVDDEAPACGNVLPSGLPGPDRPPFTELDAVAERLGRVVNELDDLVLTLNELADEHRAAGR